MRWSLSRSLLALMIVLGILTIVPALAQTNTPTIQNGSLSVENWDYAAGDPLKLEGEWEVIWGKLVAPKDFDKEYTGEIFKIPGRWNNVDHSAMNGANGVATFRARLDLPDYDKELSFHQISPHSAWRLYANGFYIGGNGNVSDKPGEHRAHYTSRIFPAYPGKSEIVLQISNYSHAFGGPGHPPTIWDSQSLFQTLGLLSLYYALVLGILFTIGMFHLIFYLADRRHREQGPVHLWFSLLCFIMVFRISGVIPYFHIYFPASAYWSDLRLPYASLFAAPTAYLLFFRTAFSEYFPKRFTAALIITNIFLVFAVLLTPEKFYTHLRDFSIGMNVFVILFSMIFTFRAMLDKQPGSAIILMSNTIFLATAVNDAVIYTDNGTGFDLTPFGILILGLGYSYALLLRLQSTFEAARQTSFALEELNLGLEKQVRERTRAFKSAAAKAENSAQDRAQFIAAASHDLRQPLHALAMFNAALKNKVQDSSAKNLITKQENSISNLGQLLQDTLDTARAEISQKEPVWTLLKLETLLADIANGYEMQAASRGVKLSLKAEPGEIVTDTALLQRLLGNLIDNALKAARQQVCLSTKRSRDKWLISVSDDGGGIARDDLDRIFESYVSLGEDGEDDHGGYGLGLYVVKNFSKLLGGSVQIESSSDKGTVFMVTVPVTPTDERYILDRHVLTDHAQPQPGMKLLAIDDETEVLDAMQVMLESWGCEIRTAEGGSQADAIIENGYRPDLIIVDYHLFGENGIDVVERLRGALNPDLAAIILTGATEPSILKKIADYGLPLLTKPIDPKRLGRFLRDHQLTYAENQTSEALIAKAASDAGE